jgi:hypothetical protein
MKVLSRKKRVTALVCLSLCTLYVVGFISLVQNQLRANVDLLEKSTYNFTAPSSDNYAIVVSDQFWYYDQPATEANVSIYRYPDSTRVASFSFYMYDGGIYVETVSDGHVLFLEAGRYALRLEAGSVMSNRFSIQVKYLNMLNPTPRDYVNGDQIAQNATLILCIVLVVLTIITIMLSVRIGVDLDARVTEVKSIELQPKMPAEESTSRPKSCPVCNRPLKIGSRRRCSKCGIAWCMNCGKWNTPDQVRCVDCSFMLPSD